ncbi:hypothetical protein TNIN_149821 [Trichonephila inaurata madagascariensis]|uniref:Uncharacterized protein n=1 Tax=Trichonephila inaurata madagascariensis TaxID=2747483 RepID=A0A8X7BNX8_9ARAC|nr:hypothetical protein TNIN_149821 [Trichonephila inaurata madagascariensis]
MKKVFNIQTSWREANFFAYILKYRFMRIQFPQSLNMILGIANTLIHGLLKKPSPTSSLAEYENDEPSPKSRVTTSIPHQATHNNEARHMPERVGDRNHRSTVQE